MINNHSSLYALKFQGHNSTESTQLSDFGTNNPRISDFPEREATIFKAMYDMCDSGIDLPRDYRLLSFPFIEDFDSMDIEPVVEPLADLLIKLS